MPQVMSSPKVCFDSDLFIAHGCTNATNKMQPVVSYVISCDRSTLSRVINVRRLSYTTKNNVTTGDRSTMQLGMFVYVGIISILVGHTYVR